MSGKGEASGGSYGIAFSGLAATLVGHGIGRFSYVALLPAVVAAGWFSGADAGYIGAANLVGYLGGALIAHRLAGLVAPTLLVPGAMLVIAASLVASSFPASFLWFLAWRFAAGTAGAVVLIVASPLVVMHAPVHLRGRVNGIVFTGIGVGIVLSGILVPVLAGYGLTVAWIGLGVAAAGLAVLTLPVWLALGRRERAAPRPAGPLPTVPGNVRLAVALIIAAYGLDAVGTIPHMLFWVDFIVRDLGNSLGAGGFYWAVFGIGAAIGPFATGMVADRIGFARTLATAYAAKCLLVALPLVATGPLALFVSSLGVGILALGAVSLTAGATLAAVGFELHRKVWGWATLAFALAQAIAAPGSAAILGAAGSYRLLYGGAALALAGATVLLVLEIGLARRRTSR
ncbi:MAG: YbfB/YjiJ family MFS transporter [Hyphomicrobiales bacterium]